MPRFTLTATQRARFTEVIGTLMADDGPVAIVQLLLLTRAELKAVIMPKIREIKTRNQNDLDTVDQRTADHKAQLNAVNADLDDLDAVF